MGWVWVGSGRWPWCLGALAEWGAGPRRPCLLFPEGAARNLRRFTGLFILGQGRRLTLPTLEMNKTVCTKHMWHIDLAVYWSWSGGFAT